MYLVTTHPRPGRFSALLQRLRQHLFATPESELERLLGSARSAGELDYLERNWAHARRRRFG